MVPMEVCRVVQATEQQFTPYSDVACWLISLYNRNGKRELDVYFLEDTLPELVDMLTGKRLGWSTEQIAAAFMAVPPLLGKENGDVGAVLRFMKEQVSQSVQLMAALCKLYMYAVSPSIHTRRWVCKARSSKQRSQPAPVCCSMM